MAITVTAFGYLVIWLFGYLVIWLFGGSVDQCPYHEHNEGK